MAQITHRITVTGSQSVGQERSEQRFTVPCMLSVREGTAYLVYDEKSDDGSRTRVTLKLDGTRAVMLRSGGSRTRMEFVPGADTRCNYATAAGTFPLEVRTRSVVHHLTAEGGTARLNYVLFHAGEILSENEVHIRLEPV